MTGNFPEKMPFHTQENDPVYTRFLKALQNGYFMAGYCKKCTFFIMPPQTFCRYCFSYIDTLEEIEPVGKIYAFSKPKVDSDNNPFPDNLFVAWIRFPGTMGGLIHFVEMPPHTHPKCGIQVVAEFKPKNERKGSLLDIKCFKKL